MNSHTNSRRLQLECTRMVHGDLLLLVLMFDSEGMLWRENKNSSIMAVQMDKYLFVCWI